MRKYIKQLVNDLRVAGVGVYVCFCTTVGCNNKCTVSPE